MGKINQDLTLPIFRVIDNSPERLTFPGAAQSAVNALTLADQISWDEAFAALMIQVHRLNLMPNNVKCIHAMLEAAGFIRQRGVRERVTVAEVVQRMNENCHDGQVAIVQSVYSRGYAVIAPAGRLVGSKGFLDPNRYHACGMDHLLHTAITNIWVRWADGEDHSPVKRRKGTAGRKKAAEKAPPADHDTFHYLQKNPRELTGDCVIRAFAALLDISWDEAMDRLTAVSGGINTTVNNVTVYGKLLREEGFVRRPAVWANGRRLTGKAFCREMDRRQLGNARIFAYVGRSHVAAILPFREKGVNHYKIVDSWDSTDRCIGEYWIKFPPEEESVRTLPQPKEAPVRQEPERKAVSHREAAAIPLGACLVHPRFGRGTVQEAPAAGLVTVNFREEGLRVLDWKWVMQNCRLEESG